MASGDSAVVKFLCSFGGRIVPRPSDGLLRYAGGETRIIAVRRDATLPDLTRKLSAVLGRPAALRYQLPDLPDLDALVSVSTPDDLDNMMDEFDRLAEASPDGSAKLRIFLSPLPPPSSALDPINSAGQRYVDAVNENHRALTRKDSLSSGSSTQNPDSSPGTGTGTDASADSSNEGTFSEITSPPAASSDDSSRLIFTSETAPALAPAVDPAQTLNPQYVNPQSMGIPVGSLPVNVALIPPCPYNSSAVDISTASVVSQVSGSKSVPAKMDSTASVVSQVSGPKSAPAKMDSYLEENTYGGMAASQLLSDLVASQVGSVKLSPPKVDSYLEENPYGRRAAAQLDIDPNYSAAYQVLPQLPPLPSAYLQSRNAERYDSYAVVPPSSQGVHTLRTGDCFMCSKSLAQAHMDVPLLHEQGNGRGSSPPETSAVLQGIQSEDAMRLQGPNRVINGTLTESMVEPNNENMSDACQYRPYGFAQIPSTSHNNETMVPPNTESSDHATVLHPPSAMGLCSDTQLSYGMPGNIRQFHHNDYLQHHQQLPQSLIQPQFLVRPDMITKSYGNDAYPVKNVNAHGTEHLTRGSVLDSSYDYARTINGMMESIRVSPFDNSGYSEKWKPIVTTSETCDLKEVKPANPPSIQNSHLIRPQVGGDTKSVGNEIINSGIIPDGIYVRPVDQLLPTSVGSTQWQNLQAAIPSHVPTSGAFLFNRETDVEPLGPNGRLHGIPAYSCVIDPAQDNNTISNIPIGNSKDEASRHLKDVTNDLGGIPSGYVWFPFPHSSGTAGHVELFQVQVPSDPRFCSQDPRTIMGNSIVLPPGPPRMVSKESVIPKEAVLLDDGVFNQPPNSLNKDTVLGNTIVLPPGPPGPPRTVSKESVISKEAMLLEDGVFHQPPNSLSKDSCPEPPVRATRGSGDEQIKQELQDVAEGVTASVLQSSVNSLPIFVDHEAKEPTPQYNNEQAVAEDSARSQSAAALGDHRIEEIKTIQVDMVNGSPVGDEIGRLQIIKNSDLEELRELGSGTFGTVYHGKWRGSDVAIKRISERCFAGKPSEQERMRSDFWNEACKLADLHHPNVVAFYGVVLDGPGGSVATVTEYMINGSLRHALQKKDKTLDHRKCLLIAMDVAFGMEYLHGKNIVHFDLKSDNLLVNLRDPQRPICKVGDLGLSKVKCHTLISGGVRGTLPWMAPELLNGSSSLVSEKVDVFSFGIVMWELLTGEEPYADLHYGAIIGGIVNNTLRPPVPESCDPDWRSLMEKCWSSEPSERPTFTEIASALRALGASHLPKGR